jgi:hypothetical protein
MLSSALLKLVTLVTTVATSAKIPVMAQERDIRKVHVGSTHSGPFHSCNHLRGGGRHTHGRTAVEPHTLPVPVPPPFHQLRFERRVDKWT